MPNIGTLLIHDGKMPLSNMERHPLVRIARIDQSLKSRPYTSLKKLMEETESSRRTVFRDLATLQEMKAPIAFSRQHNGYFYVEGSKFKLPEIELSEGDLYAMILAEQFIASTDKNYLEQKLSNSLDKFKIMFKKKIKFSPEKVFSFAKSPQAQLSKDIYDLMEKILQAIEQNKKIQITYSLPEKNKPVVMELDPYHLHFRGKWYLFAWNDYSKGYRTYAVQRIQKLEISKEGFAPKDFKSENHIGSSWGLVKGKKVAVELLFAPEQSIYMEEKVWHSSQKIKKMKDGSLKMSISVDGIDEILWWILSFGSSVRVLKPKLLGNQIKQEAKKIAKLYS